MNEDDIKKRGLICTGCHLQYNPDLVGRAKEMRKNMTAEEKKLWHVFLKDYPCRFRRQHPIDSFIVDFYCAELNLVIELDGGQHYTEGGKRYDIQRDAVLKSLGLNILRFTNNDITQKFNAVCVEINKYIK